MAANPDSVVVELIAKTDGFDAKIKKSGDVFDATRKKIAGGGDSIARGIADQERRLRLYNQVLGKSSDAHIKLGHSAGASRTSLLELGHIARATGDQLAVGTPLAQIFTQHIGQLGQAAGNSGNAMGTLGKFLGGPWGIALTLATVVLAKLTFGHKEAKDSVEALVEKLKEHAEKTRNSAEADEIWSRTLDGLIERQSKLNEELTKRLTTQGQVDEANLRESQSAVVKIGGELDLERKRVAQLERDLAQVKAQPTLAGDPEAARAATIAKLEAIRRITVEITAAQKHVGELEDDLAKSANNVTKGLISAGEAQGHALGDLSALAKLWADKQLEIIRALEQNNPTLTLSAKDISNAFETMKKAVTDAGSADVDFGASVRSVDLLNNQLNIGKIQAADYTKRILELAKALQAQADAAKEAGKQTEASAISAFKSRVQGASGPEGHGDNPNSTASGVGQFLAQQSGKALSLWQVTVQKLFAEQVKGMTAAQIDALRKNPAVANAVIDSVTNDYIKVVKAAGEKITAASLYTVHFLGAAGAKKFFAARPDAPITSVISAHTAEINRISPTSSVGDVRKLLASRIGDASTHQAAGENAIEAANKELARQATEELNRRRAFENELASLQSAELDARKTLIMTAEETAQLERDSIKLAHDKYDNDLNNLVEAGKLHEDEAAQLRGINDLRAKERTDLVNARETERKFRMEQAALQQAAQFQTSSRAVEADLLRSREGLAKTVAQRRDIERRLVDLQFAEERTANDRAIAYADSLRYRKDIADSEKILADLAATEAKQRNATIDERHSNATKQSDRSTETPLQAYFSNIQGQADDLNATFEQIAAGGLATFTDALTNAIVNFTSLGDVGRAALQAIEADLVKLAIRMIINATIGKAISAAGAAATVATNLATATAVGAAWAGPAAAASLATLGSNAVPAAAALTSTTALATILAAPKAEGGPIEGPGGPTDDKVLIAASAGEYMIRARSARRLGRAALDQMNRTGMPAFANGGLIGNRGINPSNAPAMSGTRGGFSPSDIAHLRGLIGEAVKAGVSAMPNVSLYASLDPADVLQRALGSPSGEKALLAVLGRNSGAVRATINR